jgi:hypothetical protein
VGLGLQQGGGELLIAPLLCAGAVGELGQRPPGGRPLERSKQMRQLAGRAGHAISVVTLKRSDLDGWFGRLPAGAERPGVREVGDRAVFGEGPQVAAGELARVERESRRARGH